MNTAPQTATKREWIRRLNLLDAIEPSQLSDALIRASWDALQEMRPVQKAIQETRSALAKKYAMTDKEGTPQTKRMLQEELMGEEDEEDGQPSEDEQTEVGDVLEDILADHDTVQAQEGIIVLEDSEGFEEAMGETLDEEETLDIPQVPLGEATDSEIGMVGLQEIFGWLIEGDG